jgi:hypothetical protein
MQLAAQVNGLDTPGMKPWHLKATYQTYDEQGKPKNQGTFEEWWVAPGKDIRVYSSASFTQTEYITSKGEFPIGDDTNGPPLAEYLLRQRLVSPLPGEADIAVSDLRRRDNPFPKSKLTCVELGRPMKNEADAPLGLFPLYCFEPDRPMLRFSGSFGLMNTMYERIAELDGHYVGSDLRIVDSGKPFLTVHLIEANLLGAVNEDDFTPPATLQRSRV